MKCTIVLPVREEIELDTHTYEFNNSKLNTKFMKRMTKMLFMLGVKFGVLQKVKLKERAVRDYCLIESDDIFLLITLLLNDSKYDIEEIGEIIVSCKVFEEYTGTSISDFAYTDYVYETVDKKVPIRVIISPYIEHMTFIPRKCKEHAGIN